MIIISDALRYEVAAELMQYLGREKHIATLDAALAMLPTETKFCKPALLPHRSIWLYKNDTEMDLAVDDKILNTLEKRSAHVALYRESAVCYCSKWNQRCKSGTIQKASCLYFP